MKFSFKRATAGVAAVAALTLVLSGCADTGPAEGGGDSEGSGSSEISITLLPKNLGNPYFDASRVGAEAAAADLGAEFEEVGPTEATPDGQVSYINTAAQQQRSALVVSANDPNAI
ncbi:MAG: substrate-binding domain-containing protein, partial [Microbacterium sp.]|uniref:substrate-binding domain-containing protein n=1 Tax=Microbacterium sp. TaxID=51671 RepID=UPI003F945703